MEPTSLQQIARKTCSFVVTKFDEKRKNKLKLSIGATVEHSTAKQVHPAASLYGNCPDDRGTVEFSHLGDCGNSANGPTDSLVNGTLDSLRIAQKDDVCTPRLGHTKEMWT